MGPFSKNLWSQKCPKLGVILDNFRLQLQISQEQMKISKIEQHCDQERFLPHFRWKNGALWSAKGRWRGEPWPTQNQLIKKTISQPLKAAAPSNFHVLDNQGLLTHTPPGMGIPQQFLTIKIQKLAQNS